VNKKAIVVIVSIAIIVVVASALLVSEIQNQNPKIFCFAGEALTSNWYKTDHCPALSEYVLGAPNFSSLPNVDLGVGVFNNNSMTLFNIVIEVSYKTTENVWNLTKKTDVGILDVQQYKQTKITITNPYLAVWHTQRPEYKRPDILENVTVPVLDSSDYRITAYGFARP
jgi:hypothetical protein